MRIILDLRLSLRDLLIFILFCILPQRYQAVLNETAAKSKHTAGKNQK